jgi:hypothetical protein
VKILLAMATTWNVDAIQADVPNAYVQADLESKCDLYMEVPSGIRISRDILLESSLDRGDNIVLKLEKSLYGLKQVGRLWGQYFSGKLEAAGYTRYVMDMCLYFKHYKRLRETLLAITGRIWLELYSPSSFKTIIAREEAGVP